MRPSFLSLLIIIFLPSLTPAAPTGLWEGVIASGSRPLVANVDLDRRVIKLDATGSSEWKIESIVADDLSIEFRALVQGRPFVFKGTVEASRITGTLRTPDKQFAFWLEPLPVLHTPKNRVEAWGQDLDVVVNRFFRYDRSYSENSLRDAIRRIGSLRTGLSKLNDQEIMVELARIAALSGNAHTRLYLIRNRTEVRRLPIRIWWFGNELRVVRASKQHRDLLGCEVVRIGNMTVAAATARMRNIKAGNASWQRYMSQYVLTSSDMLFGANVTPSAEAVSMEFLCEGKIRRTDLSPLPLRRSSSPVESWWDIAIENREVNSEFDAVLSPDRAPAYLRNTRKHYWFERLQEVDSIYLQYNRSHEDPNGPTVQEFIEQFRNELRRASPRGLIIDLRFNTGGDLSLATPLMRMIADESSKVRVIVITGRSTFSAGISHVTQLKEWANATIVGEPVGDELDVWSEGGNILLPNSKLTIHYTNAFHNYSKREYPGRRPYFEDLNVDSLQPDIPVQTSWQDYIAGRDPVLDSAKNLLKTNKS